MKPIIMRDCGYNDNSINLQNIIKTNNSNEIWHWKSKNNSTMMIKVNRNIEGVNETYCVHI